MFLITGITGQVGGAAARQLLSEGKHVRALVRDLGKADEWLQQGVELCQGNLNDPAALASALQGVDGAFLMVPPISNPAPGFLEAQEIVESFREALRMTQPSRVVALSSFGSERSHGIGMITSTHLLELGLTDLPFPTAFVRPGAFLENYLPDLQAAASSGQFDSYAQPTDRPFLVTATTDIGQEIAHLLIQGWEGHTVVEVGVMATPNDLARAMGEAIGREVVACAVPREQWNARMQATGMSPREADLYSEMLDATNAGWMAAGVSGTKRITATTAPEQFFTKAHQH